MAITTPPNATRHTRTARYLRHDPANKQFGEEARTVTVASATIVSKTQIRNTMSARDWQTELWDFFDTVGELRFAVRWLANAISRCTLYVGHASDESGEPVPCKPDAPDADPDDAKACHVLESLSGGRIGQGEMLRRLSLHLSLPGESYLVGIDPRPDEGITEKTWYVLSSDEIKVASGGDATATLPDTGQTIKITPDDATIIRLWIPHPRRGAEPDSAVRATLPVLREIKGLSDHISASIDSRLAGAGILAIPSSASMPTPEQSDPGMGQNPMHSDPFIASLMQHMITPIRDRDDASAVVPMVVRVNDDAIDSIRHITLSTDLSKEVAQLRQDALQRFAAGADLPRDVVTGDSSTLNHWNIWQLEEASIKLHVEPLIAVICDAFTRQFLHPALKAMGVENVQRWVVWYNAAELSQRPNKSAEAQALWDKGVLSTEALLRENGFPLGDLPTPQEHRRWLAEKLVLANPALYPYLESLDSGAPPTDVDTSPAALPAADTDGTTDPNPGGVPKTPVVASARPALVTGSEAQWWLCAVEQVALRSLELAGKRMLRAVNRSERDWKTATRRVHPWDIHTVASIEEIYGGRFSIPETVDKLIENAFETGKVNFGEDSCVMETLDKYVRYLIMSSQPHRREYLATWLTENGCLPGNG